jgi:hypothetical protein
LDALICRGLCRDFGSRKVAVNDRELISMAHRAEHVQQIRREKRWDALEEAHVFVWT